MEYMGEDKELQSSGLYCGELLLIIQLRKKEKSVFYDYRYIMQVPYNGNAMFFSELSESWIDELEMCFSIQEYIETEGLGMLLCKDYGLVLFHLENVWIGNTLLDTAKTK